MYIYFTICNIQVSPLQDNSRDRTYQGVHDYPGGLLPGRN